MKEAVLVLDVTRDSIAPEARAWGGHAVEETQKWSLEFIAAMAKSRIVLSDELMK